MESIHTVYDPIIEAYVVSFPSEVSLHSLSAWGCEFIRVLDARADRTAGLLVNTNTHGFESVDCLRWLRDFFAKEYSVKRGIDRVAFVQPIQYRVPEIVSDYEAYFSTVEDARKWLLLN